MKFLIESTGRSVQSVYQHVCSRSEEAMACSIEDVENIVFHALTVPGNQISWEDGTWVTVWTLHSDRVHVLQSRGMNCAPAHRHYCVLSSPERVLTAVLETVVGDGVLTTYTN